MKEFINKVVVVTGGARGIGKCICDQFRKESAIVCDIDILPGGYFTGDIGNESVLEAFAQKVIADFGHVDVLINNAKPLTKGLNDCTYEEFDEALRVGVTAPFYLSKLFAPCFAENASIINISSSRDRMSQPQTESYTAAKGGIAALTHSSVRSKISSNSAAPAIKRSRKVMDPPLKAHPLTVHTSISE